MQYGLGQTEIGRARVQRLCSAGLSTKEPEDLPQSARTSHSIHVDFNDDTFFDALWKSTSTVNQNNCSHIVRALALCHAAIRMSPDDEEPLGKLSAASPDELALVEAGKLLQRAV